MSYDIKDCCPKCESLTCMGDCGGYTSTEKTDFIQKRYFPEPDPVIGVKKPLPPLNIGSYRPKAKKKKK